MTTLTFDEAIERLKALPDEQKPQIALLLDEPEDLLTPEQWAEIETRLDEEEAFTPHEEVVRDFHARFGR